jgi:hypothetical protein|tara:strand:+ start:13684 stop:16479 length:2796 start_codon:yes stop_codon:yes gene_type:complete
VDTSVYGIALRTARNVTIHPFGGVSNRPGLLFVGPVKDHTKAVRVYKFQFKTADTYALEFGDLYMRVVRNDGHVTETTVAITGATAASPVVVTAVAHGYSNGDEVFIDGVVGMTQLNGRRFIVANQTANTFELTSQYDAGVTNIDGSAYTAYSSGGTVGKIYEIVTPYVEADLFELKFTQSADTITITHPSYDPRELTRTGHATWTLTVVSFDPDQDHPTGLGLTVNGAAGTTTYKYRVTAIAEDTLEESLSALNTTSDTITGATAANPVVITATAHNQTDGEQVEINGIVGMTELNGRRFKVANGAANTFELEGENGTAYTAYSSGGTANDIGALVTNGNATLTATNNVTAAWTAIAGAQRYAVYKEVKGLYGLLGETESVSYVDDGADTPDLDNSPPAQRDPFFGTDNDPAAVSYYEQRRVFGGSNNNPDTSEYTQTGNQSNVNVSTPAKANDAITATLNSREVNQIRHFVPLNDLLTLTSGAEWRVNASDDSGFSASTLRQKPQSQWGSGHREPIVVGSTVIFFQDNDSVVRSIGYLLQTDSYSGTNLTLLANHIFRHETIVDSAYAAFPNSLVHTVRSDGAAPVMTFDQEQEVIAWAVWDTPNGKFKSVTAMRPSLSDIEDAAYFVVERIINGNTVKYIERTQDRRFKTVQDAFFVDSGVSLDTPVTITNATAADPVVITATAHGFSNADIVDIVDITWVADVDSVSTETQPAQLNGGRFLVANKTAHTFELTDEDGDDIDGSAFNAYVEGGEVRKAETVLLGYDHLAGETIVANANGNVVRDIAVTVDGQITLTDSASRVHAGINYVSDVETLNLEMVTRSIPTIQGALTHVVAAVVRFERSRGFWIGPNVDALTEMAQRELEAYGEPTELLTGDKEIILEPEWNSNGRVFMRQRDPLPMTILGVVPIFDMESMERASSRSSRRWA